MFASLAVLMYLALDHSGVLNEPVRLNHTRVPLPGTVRAASAAILSQLGVPDSTLPRQAPLGSGRQAARHSTAQHTKCNRLVSSTAAHTLCLSFKQPTFV
jgi:hypothetical protein